MINIIQQAVDTWGEESQLIMVLEEFGELQDKFAKRFRGRSTDLELASEMADCKFMTKQLRYMLSQHDVFNREKLPLKQNKPYKIFIVFFRCIGKLTAEAAMYLNGVLDLTHDIKTYIRLAHQIEIFEQISGQIIEQYQLRELVDSEFDIKIKRVQEKLKKYDVDKKRNESPVETKHTFSNEDIRPTGFSDEELALVELCKCGKLRVFHDEMFTCKKFIFHEYDLEALMVIGEKKREERDYHIRKSLR